MARGCKSNRNMARNKESGSCTRVLLRARTFIAVLPMNGAPVKKLACVAFIFALLVTACGGGSGENAESSPSTTAKPVTTTTTKYVNVAEQQLLSIIARPHGFEECTQFIGRMEIKEALWKQCQDTSNNLPTTVRDGFLLVVEG